MGRGGREEVRGGWPMFECGGKTVDGFGTGGGGDGGGGCCGVNGRYQGEDSW